MHCSQETLSGSTLATKASTSFSTTSSTQVGSKLLFGEIDGFSDQSSYHSLCSLVHSSNSSFIRVWNSDDCRSRLLSFLPLDELVTLRLVCHDFSTRLAPTVFADMAIKFRSRTFSRPAKLAALDRVGHLVKTLTFSIAHTQETLLPPLIDPWTGEERDFVYPPQAPSPTKAGAHSRLPKYGDWEVTDLLTKQYPPLFHAATNADAFTRALSSLVNLSHLKISCPVRGGDCSTSSRKSIVDFALTSLRMSIQSAGPRSLTSISLLQIHPRGLLYFSPLLGPGAGPASLRKWSSIQNLTMHVYRPTTSIETQDLRALHAYTRSFTRLQRLEFRWLGEKGPSPLPPSSTSHYKTQPQKELLKAKQSGPHPQEAQHPALRAPSRPRKPLVPFPHLTHLTVENATMSAPEIRALISAHRRTLEDVNFESIALIGGTWDEALSPLGEISGRDNWRETTAGEEMKMEMGDVPIMLAPSLPGAGAGAGAGSRRKRVKVDSVAQVRSFEPCTAVRDGRAAAALRRETRGSPLACRGVLCDSGAADGARSLLSAPTPSKKPKRKKRGLCALDDVLRAVRGGLMSWR